MRILDLGIGTGNLAARVLQRGCVVWGVDFSAAMLARARARVFAELGFIEGLVRTGPWPYAPARLRVRGTTDGQPGQPDPPERLRRALERLAGDSPSGPAGRSPASFDAMDGLERVPDALDGFLRRLALGELGVKIETEDSDEVLGRAEAIANRFSGMGASTHADVLERVRPRRW